MGALLLNMGRDSADGIVTRCGLGGPGIECLCWRDFYTCPDWFWGSPSLLCNGYLIFLRGMASTTHPI